MLCATLVSLLQTSDLIHEWNLNSPIDSPDSIKELALRPRMPTLLRLEEDLPLFSFLISLFRRMTGVSAKGKAIFFASS